MLIEQLRIHRLLARLVQTLTTDWTMQEDLMQEALLHLWVQELRCPGQTQSWYLQSCQFRLRNYLHGGRSVDSVKRGRAACAMPDSPESNGVGLDGWESDESLLPSVCAHDMLDVLLHRINPREREILACLADGFGVREIARHLHVSHQAVSKHRNHIAALATQLGISPPPHSPQRGPNQH